MLEPQTAKLRITRCVSDSFSAWTNNLPILFLATLLDLLVGLSLFPFFLVATITGLMLITHDAISGERVRVRDVLRPLLHPIRFVFLNSFCLWAPHSGHPLRIDDGRVEDFIGSAPRTDDLTVVALKRAVSPSVD